MREKGLKSRSQINLVLNKKKEDITRKEKPREVVGISIDRKSSKSSKIYRLHRVFRSEAQ